MITVHVRYFNILAALAETKQASIKVPQGMTLRQLIDHLAAINSDKFRAFLFDGDELHSYLRIFHNERLIKQTLLADIIIEDGDEIMLFPAVAGG